MHKAPVQEAELWLKTWCYCCRFETNSRHLRCHHMSSIEARYVGVLSQNRAQLGENLYLKNSCVLCKMSQELPSTSGWVAKKWNLKFYCKISLWLPKVWRLCRKVNLNKVSACYLWLSAATFIPSSMTRMRLTVRQGCSPHVSACNPLQPPSRYPGSPWSPVPGFRHGWSQACRPLWDLVVGWSVGKSHWSWRFWRCDVGVFSDNNFSWCNSHRSVTLLKDYMTREVTRYVGIQKSR